MPKKKNTTGVPQHEIDSFARVLLPVIQKLFESAEGQREFAEWKARRDQQKQQNIHLNIKFNKDLAE